MSEQKGNVRPPFSMHIQVRDADGKVVTTYPTGIQIEMGNLQTLESYGRLIGSSTMIFSLLKSALLLLLNPFAEKTIAHRIRNEVADAILFVETGTPMRSVKGKVAK